MRWVVIIPLVASCAIGVSCSSSSTNVTSSGGTGGATGGTGGKGGNSTGGGAGTSSGGGAGGNGGGAAGSPQGGTGGGAGADAGDASTSDASGDSSLVDVASDAPVLTETFGERPASNHKNVTTDTYLESLTPTQTHGNTTPLVIDGATQQVALIRFDLSVIPKNAVVTSAKLRVFTTQNGGSSDTIGIFPITELWVEAEASWNQRFNGSGWMTAGGSHDPTSMGSLSAPNNQTEYLATLSTNVVQNWVSDPTKNNGLILIGQNATGKLELRSSEYLSPTDARPQLDVSYQQ